MVVICEISPSMILCQGLLSSFRSCLGIHITEMSWVEFPVIHRINYLTIDHPVFLLLKSFYCKRFRYRGFYVNLSVADGHTMASSLHFEKLCLSDGL